MDYYNSLDVINIATTGYLYDMDYSRYWPNTGKDDGIMIRLVLSDSAVNVYLYILLYK